MPLPMPTKAIPLCRLVRQHNYMYYNKCVLPWGQQNCGSHHRWRCSVVSEAGSGRAPVGATGCCRQATSPYNLGDCCVCYGIPAAFVGQNIITFMPRQWVFMQFLRRSPLMIVILLNQQSWGLPVLFGLFKASCDIQQNYLNAFSWMHKVWFLEIRNEKCVSLPLFKDFKKDSTFAIVTNHRKTMLRQRRENKVHCKHL